MNKRRGLGRGLEALIPASDSLSDGSRRSTVLHLPIDSVRPNPDQPRRVFSTEALRELSDSIRQHGILQPILVRELPDEGYELIAGERRLRAAEMAGLREIPAVVRGGMPAGEDRLLLSLIENLQRSDLNPIEEARALRRLVDDFGLTHEAVATMLARDDTGISHAVRLLGLPEAILHAIETSTISAGHGRVLLGLPSAAQQISAMERIIQEGWSVRQTEDYVRAHRAGAPVRTGRPERAVDPDTLALEDEFRRALGTKVVLTRLRKGGRLTIEFYSDEELSALRERLLAL